MNFSARVKIERTTSFRRALLPIADTGTSSDEIDEIDDLEEPDTSGNDSQPRIYPQVKKTLTSHEESELGLIAS